MNKHGPVAQLVSVPPCHGGGRGFKSRQGRSERQAPCLQLLLNSAGLSSRTWLSQPCGSVAQLVERTTENREVTGSTPVGATRMIITSSQRPSRSFYPRGFRFSPGERRFPNRSPACGRPVVERAQRVEAPLSDAAETPPRGVCAGNVPGTQKFPSAGSATAIAQRARTVVYLYDTRARTCALTRVLRGERNSLHANITTLATPAGRRSPAPRARCSLTRR